MMELSHSPLRDVRPVLSPCAHPPLVPLLPIFGRRQSSRRFRHRELSQLMHDRKGSFLSTASLALAGIVPRTSKSSTPEREGQFEDTRKNQSIWRRTKQSTQYVYEKLRLKHLLPLLILVGYSVIGGAVIYWIEAPIELGQLEGKQKFLDDQKLLLSRTIWEVRENRTNERTALMTLRESVYWYAVTTLYMDGNFTRIPPPTYDISMKVEKLRTYTKQMAERCWEIRQEISSLSDAKRKVEKSLKDFEKYTGVPTEVKPIWTFSNALFLAVTIYTTIGYGSIAPHTVAGRVASIIYAIIGIPIYVIIIHKLGRVFLKLLHKLWKSVVQLMRYCECARRSGKWRRQMIALENETSVNNIPVSLAVGVTFAWMLTCAGICCLFFETSWDYFTSFYFFFISLTTIGLGDVTPTEPEYMFTMFGLIIVGLSLVSMCINVVQLKLELLFEEMMLALMEEYEKTGQIIDGEIVGDADFQRGLGFSQILKLWKKKRAVRKNSAVTIGSIPILPAGGFFLPLIAKKRRATLLMDIQRRAREKSTGTQTDAWDRNEAPVQRCSIEYEKGTQTDWMKSTRSLSLVTCSGSLRFDEAQEDEELFHSDLSVYSDIGCPHQHSLGCLNQSAATERDTVCLQDPCRPWSSLAVAPPVKPKVAPLRACDKHVSTPEVSKINTTTRRHRQHGVFDTFRPFPERTNIRYPCKTDAAGLKPAISYYYRTSPTAFADHPQLDHCRYWLAEFQPAAPPGGGVLATVIRRRADVRNSDEFESLGTEICCKPNECRHIVKQHQDPAINGEDTDRK